MNSVATVCHAQIVFPIFDAAVAGVYCVGSSNSCFSLHLQKVRYYDVLEAEVLKLGHSQQRLYVLDRRRFTSIALELTSCG